MKKVAGPALVFSLLLILLVPSAVPRGHAVSYLPGVVKGDWAKYNVTSYWSTNLPGEPTPVPIKQLENITSVETNVTSVSGEYVSVIELVTFRNNTQPQVFDLEGNVLTGVGNLTTFIIAGGLSPGDPIYSSPGAPTLNYTLVEWFAGQIRSANVYNFTYNYLGVSTFAAQQWERYSGLGVEATYKIDLPGAFYAHGLSDIKMVASNISHAPPGFSVAGASTATLTTGTTGKLILYVHSLNGFSSNLTIEATSKQPGATVTVHPSKITVPVDGQVNATVSLTSTTVGSYTVNVTITNGYYYDTKIDTFTVSQATPPPPSTPSQPSSSSKPTTILGLDPIMFYAIVGAAVAILAAITAIAITIARRPSPSAQPPVIWGPPPTPPPSQ